MTSEYTIDAKNRTIGRVASEAAKALMGKDSSSFVRNAAPKIKVSIVNASKTKVLHKKMIEKIYYRFSGYPGGRRGEALEKVLAKKGFDEVYTLAVYGMLPKNKLRKIMMKNLHITE